MMPAISQSSLDDLICIWLDEAIPILEKLDFMRWPGERDISLPEVLRANLFFAIKQFVEKAEAAPKPGRNAIKFPSSVISRVQNAISHLNSRRTEEEPRLRSTVFLPMSISQLAQQIPVAQALTSVGKSHCFLFQSQKWIEDINLEGLDIARHSRTLQCEILSARLRARVLWLRLGREDHVALPIFRFFGREIDLGRIALEVLSCSITSVFEGYALANYVLEYIRPRLIVVGDDLSPLGRLMTMRAKSNGIRSVGFLSQVQDSPIDSYRLSDRFVVFGNYSKRVLTASGIDTRKINACGAPYLDALATTGGSPFLTRSQSGTSKKTLTIIADLSPALVSVFLNVAKKMPNYFILFLTEQGKNKNILRDLRSENGNFKMLLKGELSSGNYAACLKSADIVATASFRTAIEAIGIGKQVVAMDFDNGFNNREFLRNCMVEIATDENSLFEILTLEGGVNLKVNNQANKRKFFEDYFYRRDGNSSQRIARVLIEECQR